MHGIPTDIATLLNEATQHYHAGRHADAERALLQILVEDPSHAYAQSLLSATLLKLGRHEEAVAAYDKTILLKPDDAKAYSDRGVALNALERADAALASYDKAMELDPTFALTYYNRGLLLAALMRHDEALASYDRAIELDPTHAQAFSSRGNTLVELDRFEEAIENYEQAIAVNPKHGKAYSNRGSALNRLNRLDEALAAYDQGIALDPSDWGAFRNKSHLLLLMGDFAQGWPLYEKRWSDEKVKQHQLTFSRPLWLGTESLVGKRILIHAEQGFGDTLQICRYLRLLEEMGATPLFAPQRKLKTLLSCLGVTIVDLAEIGEDFDFHCPSLSLPLAFQTTLTSIPSPGAYLQADPARVAHWKNKIGGRGFRVGICWQGSTEKVDKGRSFPLKELRAISGIPDIRLISLHKGAGEGQLADMPPDMQVETLGADFDAGSDAFLDSAAVIMLCDLVITSDTAIAHLAGALGRTVWVALKHVPDWRWLLERKDSPWYPTARLFRQKSFGDWRGVFTQIETELRARVPNLSARP